MLSNRHNQIHLSLIHFDKYSLFCFLVQALAKKCKSTLRFCYISKGERKKHMNERWTQKHMNERWTQKHMNERWTQKHMNERWMQKHMNASNVFINCQREGALNHLKLRGELASCELAGCELGGKGTGINWDGEREELSSENLRNL